MDKYRLMVPGPTPLPPEVTAAAVAPMEDERTPEYAAVFTGVLRNLQRVLFTGSDVLLFASSMTGAFEGTFQNLFSAGDRVVVANNGAFGQRWVDMGRAFGLDVVEVAQPWGEPLDADRIAAAVATGGVAGAVCVHSETSTGVVNDVEAFAAAAGDAVSIVDAASSVGACELYTDDWGIDVVVGGCQKALMTPPGLSFASVSPRAWERHRHASTPRYYFDWDAAAAAARADIPRTPWTPAISLINQLDAALERMHAEGMQEVFRRHVRLGRMARAGVRGLGLRLFSPDEDRSCVLTAAEMPGGVDAEALVDSVRRHHGVQLTAGQGRLRDRIVRIGHCGWIDHLDVAGALAALELCLADLGHRPVTGDGVAAALRQLAADARPRPARVAAET